MSGFELIVLLATGAVAGAVGGLLGIGGGVVVVPVLIALLPTLGVPGEHVVRMAVATSLAAVVFTSLSSTLAHYRRDKVNIRLMLWAGPTAALAGWGGALLTGYIPGEWHRRGFAIFLGFVAIRLLVSKSAAGGAGNDGAADPEGFSRAGAAMSGVVVGIVSGLLGIGGGSVSVPLFHLGLKLPIHRSVGTSAAVGIWAAALGSVGHLMAQVPPDTGIRLAHIGFVYWPAVLVIAACTIFTAQLGARLASRIQPMPLRRAFGLFLLFVSARLLMG